MQLIDVTNKTGRVEAMTHCEFMALYEPVHVSFCRYCRAVAGNADDADDLVQETVLAVLQGFGAINDRRAFKAYLYSTAGNLHKMRLRRHKFRAVLSEQEMGRIVDHGQNQEYVAEFKLIYEKILLLPPKTSEALILFHISDLSLDEIQKIQGGSLSGVKLRLKRGREKLLAMLNKPEQVKVAMMFLSL